MCREVVGKQALMGTGLCGTVSAVLEGGESSMKQFGPACNCCLVKRGVSVLYMQLTAFNSYSQLQTVVLNPFKLEALQDRLKTPLRNDLLIVFTCILITGKLIEQLVCCKEL